MKRLLIPVLVLLLALSACYSADEEGLEIPDLTDYGQMPSFILEDLSGTNHDSNDLYDFVVLFFFYDVDCSDCPLDFAELTQLRDGIVDSDFMIVALAQSASPQQVSQYLDLYGYSSDLDLVDRDSGTVNDFVELIDGWDQPEYPYLILKDRDDTLAYAYEGSIKSGGMRPILDVLARDLLSQ